MCVRKKNQDQVMSSSARAGWPQFPFYQTVIKDTAVGAPKKYPQEVMLAKQDTEKLRSLERMRACGGQGPRSHFCSLGL